jgi:hypothetical protein
MHCCLAYALIVFTRIFILFFLKAQSHPPVGILEDVVAEREIELGGQTTTTTTGMKLG